MEFMILNAIQNIRSDLLDKIMIIITSMGNFGAIWIFLGIVFFIKKDRRKIGSTIIISLILSLLVGNIIVKNIVKRERPSWGENKISIIIKNPQDYSFPSGHTQSSFAAAVAIYINRKKQGIVALILASLIAFSRLYLYVHFPSDVLGAMIIGICIGIIANKIVNILYRKSIINPKFQ